MEKTFSFQFEGKERLAELHISLQDEGCFLFTIIKDQDIINRFGEDIDFEIRDNELHPHYVNDSPLHGLQSVILNAAKKLPEYEFQKGNLKVKVLSHASQLPFQPPVSSQQAL